MRLTERLGDLSSRLLHRMMPQGKKEIDLGEFKVSIPLARLLGEPSKGGEKGEGKGGAQIDLEMGFRKRKPE